MILTSLILKGRRGRSSDLAIIFKRRCFTTRKLLPPGIEVAGIRTQLRYSVGKIEEERTEEIKVVVVIGKT